MFRKASFHLALSLVLTGVCLGSAALAQTADDLIPGGAGRTDAGIIIPTPTEQEQEKKIKQEEKSLPDGSAKPEEVKIDVAPPTATVQIQEQKIHAEKIIIENANLLSESEKQEIIAPYEGKDLSLETLQEIVDKVNEKYRERGLLTSQAFVPPQEVKSGTITIKVVEGRVGQLCATGNRFNRAKAIFRRINTDPGDRFNLKKLEKDLNNANKFSENFRLRATLSPGDETGETDVKVEAVEKQPWQITPSFDNQGRPFIGTYRYGVELANSSLLGWEDRFSARYMGADGNGTNVILGTYFVPLNGRGTELGMSYGHSRVNVDLEGVTAQPEIVGKADNYGLILSHPLDYDRVWVADIGLNARRIRTFVDDIQDPSRDDIRSVQVGLNFNKFDRLGRTFARVQSSAGFNMLGGNAGFWKAETFITRLFNMPWNNVLMLRLYGQYSPDALPSAEQFQIGGAYSVRGFSEGVLIGDRGYNFTIEDRFPIPLLSRNDWINRRLQGVVFFDIGQTFRDKSDPTRYIGNTAANTFLVGTGVGLRARLSQYLQGFVDLGFGLVDRSAQEPKAQPTARVHFGVRSDLLPEVYKARNNKIQCIDEKGRVTKKSQPAPQTSQVNPVQPAQTSEAATPADDIMDETPTEVTQTEAPFAKTSEQPQASPEAEESSTPNEEFQPLSSDTSSGEVAFHSEE